MEIKKANINNLQELQEIGINSYLPHYAHLWKTGGAQWYLEHCFGNEILQRELNDDNIEYYIASAEQKNIGILKLVLDKLIPDSEDKSGLYLEKIYFVKEWTGKGAGRELIKFVLEKARELKRDCVWLMAMDTSEKPIAAYEKSGFSIYSRTRLDFELMKEEFRGMVVMTNCFEKNGN